MLAKEWLSSLEGIIKMRLANYRITSNNFYDMAQFVYNEIANEIVLDFYDQSVKIVKDQIEYDLDALHTPDLCPGILKDVVSVKDDNGYTIDGFVKLHYYVYSFDKYEYLTLEQYVDKELIFKRIYIPPIEKLTTGQQLLIQTALIEGIVYYIEDAIPSPTSSAVPLQESTGRHKRYQMAKEQIRINSNQR